MTANSRKGRQERMVLKEKELPRLLGKGPSKTLFIM